MTEEQIKDYVSKNCCNLCDNRKWCSPKNECFVVNAITEATKELQETNHRLTKQLEDLDTDNDYLEEQNNTLTQNLEVKEKRITELEKQIEEMKICQNCKFEDNDYLEKPCCDCSRCLGNIKRNGNSDKWEIKEND